MAAEILAAAMVKEETSVSCFPFFGQERRGAPVQAYVRYGAEKVRVRSRIYYPHIVMIMDARLANNPICYNGILSGGMVISNAPLEIVAAVAPAETSTIVTLNANEIALEVMGKAITNTAMLGCFAGATGAVKLETLKVALEDYFKGKVLKNNQDCMERGYHELKIYNRQSDGAFLLMEK